MNYWQKNHLESLYNRKAIILCDRHEIKDSLSYEEVQQFHQQISELISNNIKDRHTCIGLEMAHNMYIPSIILSLKDLSLTFMFLNPHDKDNEEIKRELGIVWTLSFKELSTLPLDRLILRNSTILYLSKNENPQNCGFENIFFVIRTSGTTGRNKFVKVPHRCIEVNVKSLSDHFKLTCEDVIYFGTPLTFDPSIIELLLALENGCCLLIVPPVKKINQNFLYDTLFLQGATFLQIVPSLFLRWSQKQIENILLNSCLKILAFGGEVFPRQILSFAKCEDLKVFNLYGITEVSCWAMINEVVWSGREVSLGNELDETVVEVRDGDRKVIEGEGEIFIGSSSRVCLVDQETSFGDRPVFRATGDIGAISSNRIVFKGRKNDTVKRLGNKVNLKQIEDSVFQETGLQNKCVWLQNDAKLLNFIVIPNFNTNVKDKIIDKIRVKLLQSLPPSSFPDNFEIVQKFPVTSHGKIDTRFLQEIYLKHTKQSHMDHVGIFKNLICKYFGFNSGKLPEVLELNFFEIGGNSVLAIQFLEEFSSQARADCPDLVTVLFENNLGFCLNYLNQFRPSPNNKIRVERLASPVPAKKLKSDEIQLKIFWKHDMKACVDASPVVFENGNRILVAVGSFSRRFAIIDTRTGEDLTGINFLDSVESTATISPCGNLLYVGCFDGNLYCLDCKLTIKWVYHTEDRIKCKPALCRNSSAVVFGSYDKNVYCVSKDDGTLDWKTCINERITSSPVVDENNQTIYVATLSGTCLSLSEATGKVLWKYKSASPIFGTPCLHNHSIVWPNVNGNLFCSSVSGDKLWDYPCGGHLYASPVRHDDWLIFGCHDSNLYFVEMSTRSEEVVSLDSPISSSVAVGEIHDKTVVVVTTTSGLLYLIDFVKRVILAELRLPGEIFSSPCIYGHKIYVGCRDNNLYCIECTY